MKQVLKAVKDRLHECQINYAFLRWKDKPIYPYYVGELFETSNDTESGECEYDFILSGFYRGENEVKLIETAEIIKEAFPKEEGYMVKDGNGSVCIWYDSMIPDTSTDTDAELCKNQITLKVKSWKGRK